MKKNYIIGLLGVLLMITQACQKTEKLDVEPLSLSEYPLVVVLSDEHDGDLEDNDEIGIAVELLTRWDEVTRNPEGSVPEMPTDVDISFQLENPQGFSQWNQYIKGVKAIYEIDDCTNSEDAGIVIPTSFDPATGTGTFRFPKGQKEMELVLELDDAFFDDAVLNTDLRGFELKITGIQGAPNVRVNKDLTFAYHVLDDEAIFGTWEVDPLNASAWQALLNHFGPLNEDLSDVQLADVDKVEIEFEQAVLKVKFILNATQPDPCDPTELENEEIEVEADFASDFEDLFNNRSGELELEGKAEKDGVELEFEMKAKYTISADGTKLNLVLSGELDGDDLPEITLTLTR